MIVKKDHVRNISHCRYCAAGLLGYVLMNCSERAGTSYFDYLFRPADASYFDYIFRLAGTFVFDYTQADTL